MLKSMVVNKDIQAWHLIASISASQSKAMLENFWWLTWNLHGFCSIIQAPFPLPNVVIAKLTIKVFCFTYDILTDLAVVFVKWSIVSSVEICVVHRWLQEIFTNMTWYWWGTHCGNATFGKYLLLLPQVFMFRRMLLHYFKIDLYVFCIFKV